MKLCIKVRLVSKLRDSQTWSALIDNIYIDGPCELLIKRLIDNLLAEIFVIRNLQGQIVLPTFELGKS